MARLSVYLKREEVQLANSHARIQSEPAIRKELDELGLYRKSCLFSVISFDHRFNSGG